MKLALAAALAIAHFTATSVNGTATRICGTVTATSATYAGAGARIVARSTIDSRTGTGVVTGTLETATITARFSAVYDHGVLSGVASGHMGDRTVVANLSAAFSPAGGFTAGVLGGRGDGGGAAVLASTCSAPPQKVLRRAQGIVEVATTSVITLGGLTCIVPPTLAMKLIVTYTPGTWAAITCSVSNGQTTLVTIRGKQ